MDRSQAEERNKVISNQSTCAPDMVTPRQPSPGWNDTSRDYPTDTCLHHLFDRQAALTPDRVALVFEDETLRYEEVSERANQVANYLSEHGVGTESLVGVLMERSLELPIALLGILKAGAAYVPLDPDYPIERLRNMIEDGDPPIILTQNHLPGNGYQAHRRSFQGSRLLLLGRRQWRDRASAFRAIEGRCPARESCLCDLHLGIDG